MQLYVAHHFWFVLGEVVVVVLFVHEGWLRHLAETQPLQEEQVPLARCSSAASPTSPWSQPHYITMQFKVEDDPCPMP